MWEAASPEERKALREKARALREEALRRLDGILQEKGLRLTQEQRRAFFRAYLQGRREIERTLRQRMQAEREKMEAALIDRLLQDGLAGSWPEESADAPQAPELNNTPEHLLPSPEPGKTSSPGAPAPPFSAP